MPLKFWKRSIILSAHIKHSALLINSIRCQSQNQNFCWTEQDSWPVKLFGVGYWSNSHCSGQKLIFITILKRNGSFFLVMGGLIVWDQKNDVIRYGQNIKLLSLSIKEGVVCTLQGGIGGCRFWLYPHTNTPDPTNQTPAESRISTIRCKKAARELNHWVCRNLWNLFSNYLLCNSLHMNADLIRFMKVIKNKYN